MCSDLNSSNTKTFGEVYGVRSPEHLILHGCLSNRYRSYGSVDYETPLIISLYYWFFFLLDLSLVNCSSKSSSSSSSMHDCLIYVTALCSHPTLKAELFMPSWALLQHAVSVFHKHLTYSHAVAGEMNYQWQWLRR